MARSNQTKQQKVNSVKLKKSKVSAKRAKTKNEKKKAIKTAERKTKPKSKKALSRLSLIKKYLDTLRLKAKDIRKSYKKTIVVIQTSNPVRIFSRLKSRFLSVPQISKTFGWIYANRVNILVISVLLGIAAYAHGNNMFNYPYYENDEGTYLSRGWSLITEARLDPYTYWYDHVPFASFMLGFWLFITGGLDTFGMAVNSGRVFMLLIHLINVGLIYYIGLRITGRRFMGIIAALMFSLSPLSIYFGRRLLLDNIIVFWTLLTFAILLKRNLTLRWIMISAVTFALGVLTKENVILFLPAFVYVIFSKTKKTRMLLSISNWLILSGCIVGLYVLYALLKQELFFPGSLGTPEDSVSLLYTLKFHLGRGNGLPFWETGSDFYGNYVDWMNKDKYVIYAAAVSFFMLIPMTLRKVEARYLLIFSLIHAWFLMRGALILNFYIVFVIPFIALNTGYVLDQVFVWLNAKIRIPLLGMKFIAIIVALGLFIASPKPFFTVDENEPFRQSVAWANENLNEDDIVVVDNAIYLDLQNGEKKIKNADWFWKFDTDPDVYVKKLNEEWTNIDYIFLSHETVKQIASGQFVFVQNALESSDLVASWEENTSSFIDLNQYLSTNGDWTRVYKVPNKDELVTRKTWDWMKSNYLYSYGQAYDYENSRTTSYMQTNWMLLSLYAGDQQTFDGVLSWTNDHFKHRIGDSLLAREWTQEDPLVESGEVTDSATSTRADIQYAASLLMAYELWGDEKYLTGAQRILPDIWETEIFELRSRYYPLTGSDSGVFNDFYNIIDEFEIDPYASLPSYLDLFIKYDTEREWSFLLEDWYDIFSTSNSKTSSGISLIPQQYILSLDGELEKDLSPRLDDMSSIFLIDSLSRSDELDFLLELVPSISRIESRLTDKEPSELLFSEYANLLVGYQEEDMLAEYSTQKSDSFNVTKGEWEELMNDYEYIEVWLISDFIRNK